MSLYYDVYQAMNSEHQSELDGSEYLGDGVYIKQENSIGWFILFTSDGMKTTNKIFLGPEVCQLLTEYLTKNQPTTE